MSTFPTPSDYQEAVQFPDTAFRDDELQDAEPDTNVLGLPQPITGAFAAVFPMTTEAGRRYAVKCFLSDVPDQQRRYAAVAQALEKADLESTVHFEYQTRGIDVEGETYPVLKMEWAEGTALNRFVAKHRDAPDVLQALAQVWTSVMGNLDAAGIAHGDLQHGNVLVQTGDAPDDVVIRLVDYDATYVPALQGGDSREVGHRNYQHPDRTDEDFGPYLDRFAALAIYVALRVVAERPDLWDRFDTGENLLFRDADFYDPASSVLFDELENLDAVQDEVEALRTACYVEPEDVPPLDDVRSGEGLDGATVKRSRRTSRDDGRRRPRDTFAQLALPVLLGWTVVVAAGGWAGGGPVAALLALIGVIGAGGGVASRYQRLPLVRRRRRLRREAERFTRLIQTRQREIESLKETRADVLDSVEQRRDERLAEVQQEALYEKLKHHFVGEARSIEGVTHKHIVRLKASNLRTAYETSPEALQDVKGLPNDARARLRQWRASLVRQYEDDVPDTLSPAEDRRLQRYVQHRIDDIDTKVARLQEKIDVFRVERDAVEERLDTLPDVTVGRYVGYLLRLRTLPTMETGRSAPAPVKERAPVPQTDVAEDRPWWEHG